MEHLLMKYRGDEKPLTRFVTPFTGVCVFCKGVLEQDSEVVYLLAQGCAHPECVEKESAPKEG
jgi:hypothetical protein